MTQKQIFEKKQRGDNVLVAQMLTKKLGRYISPMNAGKLLERTNAKNHQDALTAYRKVIESRESLLQNQV